MKNKKSKHLKENSISKKNKKQNEKKKEKTQEQIKRNKKRVIIIIALLIIAIIFFGIYTAISINNWKKIIQEMSKNETSIVKDTDGNTIAEIGGEKAKNKISASDSHNALSCLIFRSPPESCSGSSSKI